MKIGINLNGVSYHDGSSYRRRNYADSIEGFTNNVINPLKEEGHDVSYYLFTYDSEKKDEIIKAYNPVKSTFIANESNYNNLTSGDKLSNGYRMMTLTTINSLNELVNENLDLVISTRFDINFFKNPFKEYQYDFTKCNFLWREPEFIDLPIVNDTFIVFPHHMIINLMESFMEQEENPPFGVVAGNHNIYLPMIDRVGKDKVQWVCDEFINTATNTLYKLMRNE